MGRSPVRTVLKKEAREIPGKLGKPFVPFFTPGEKGHSASSDSVRPLASKTLVNIINYLHFSDRSLLVHLERNGKGKGCILPVHPEPCLDGEISCRWSVEGGDGKWGEMIQNLIIDDGKAMIVVPAEVRQADQRSFRITLPNTSYVVARRESKRYRCNDISAQIEGNGHLFWGELDDFGPGAFRVQLRLLDGLRRPSLQSGDTMTVELRTEETVIFSGVCICKRVERISTCWEAVFSPAVDSVEIFQKRTVRNPRVQLKPPAMVSFRHPVLRTQVQMEVYDLCSSGFSVFEAGDGILLFPGMRIPDLTVCHAGSTIARVSAQVVYRTTNENEITRCGIAIMDMDLDEYGRINRLVENALDPNAKMSENIDPAALWEFFFSVGFIYPKKYHLLSSSKRLFRENFRKILQNTSDVVQHFTYEKNGRIYGYHSIVWAYHRSWLIHHHAGRSMGNRMGGLMVLKQTMHFLNDMHRFPSSNMQYAMTFYRPENRFPNLVFGRFANRIKDKKACSTDRFSYLSFGNRLSDIRLPQDWHLASFSSADREALRKFYAKRSGGLLLDALSLNPNHDISGGLESLYSRYGFCRRVHVHALRKGEKTMAVFVEDHSDRGLNFSELLNCIKVIVIRPQALPWKILRKVACQLAQQYEMEKVPVMIYPSQYLEEQGIPSEKTYQLWILSVDAGDRFMEYMHHRLRIC